MRPEHNPCFPVEKLRDSFVCSYCLQPVRRGGCGDIVEIMGAGGVHTITTCANAPPEGLMFHEETQKERWNREPR